MFSLLRWAALGLSSLGMLTACQVGGAAPPDTARTDTRVPVEPAAPADPISPEARNTPIEGGGQKDTARQRVFFSGHSLLDNPMPDWVELIATSRGDSLGWEEQIVLGSPIRVRTKGDDPNATSWPGYDLGKSKSGGRIQVLRELANPTQLAAGEKYSTLLITERSDFMGAIKWEDTIGNLRHFHDRLVEHDRSARTLLYQCWPAIDKDDPQPWLEYVRAELFAWQCVAAQVNQSLKREGRSDRVNVIPGGVALSHLVDRALDRNTPGNGSSLFAGSRRQRLDAIFSDDAHLTPLATYLLSAVHYGALFGKSPVGAAGPHEVPGAAVPILQQLAWDTLTRAELSPKHSPPLSECRRRAATELCPLYYRSRGKPEEVAGCGYWASSESPFADPATPGAQ